MMLRSIVLLLLVFGLGAAIGSFTAWAVADRRHRDEAANRPMPAPGDERPAASREPSAPPPAKPRTAEPGSGPRSSPAPGAELDEALKRVAAEEAPLGGGVIRGQVLTVDSKPLAGVRIVAVPSADEEGHPGTDVLGDLGTQLRAYVQWLRRQHGLRRETTSGDDGSFAIDGLHDAWYQVVAAREGWEFERAGAAGDLQKPGSPAFFVATPVGTLAVDIAMPDGTPPDAGTVRATHVADQFERVLEWTPARRSLKLPAGRYSVVATQGAQSELRSEEAQVEVAIPERGERVKLVLAESRGIVVSVELPPEFPLEGVFVALLTENHEGGLDMTESAVVERWSGFRVAWMNAPAGGHRVRAQLTPELPPLAEERVVVGAGLSRVTLRIPAVGAADLLRIRARGPDGSLLPKADVRVSWALSSPPLSVEPGVYVLPRPPQGADARFVSVWAPGLGELSRRVTPATGELEFAFSPAASVEVVAVGVVPPVEPGEMSCRLTSAEGDDGFAREDVESLDPAGRARFGPIQPGRYRLQLDSVEAGFDSDATAQVRVFGSGSNTVSLAVPAAGSLTIELPAGEHDLSLTLRNATGANIMQFGTSGGHASIPRLAAGRYFLFDDWGREIPVDVSGPTNVIFAPPAPPHVALVLGTIDDALAAFGLTSGDTIASLDGLRFTSREEFALTLADLARQPEVTIGFERQGRTFEVDVPGRLAPLVLAGAWISR